MKGLFRCGKCIEEYGECHPFYFSELKGHKHGLSYYWEIDRGK
jgi:hypothetical protein